MTNLVLADISNNNGQGGGFAAIQDPSVAAVYAKGTQGVTFRDPLWPVFRAEAKRLNKPIGPYAFLDPAIDGAAQAKYLLAYTTPAAGDLQPVIDSETWGSSPEQTAVTTFNALAALRAAGFNPLGYGSGSFWSKLVSVEPQLGQFHYWEVDFGPTLAPVQGLDTVLWQFAGTMAVGRGRFHVDGERLIASSLAAIEYRPA